MDAPFLTLGELIARTRSESGALAAWLEGEEAALLARLENEAHSECMSLGRYLRFRLMVFCEDADEEAWATVLSRARGGADPGKALLMAVVMQAAPATRHAPAPEQEAAP
jgi:hypothetical protein